MSASPILISKSTRMFATNRFRFLPLSFFPTLSRSRSFTSTKQLSSRAIVFTSNGAPSDVVRVVSFSKLPPPPLQSLNIKFILSPINPSDINVIEGVYPAKPNARSDIADEGPGSKQLPCCIVGNEGLAEVKEVGKGVNNFKVGDRVVMVKPQAGTWSTGATVQEQDVVKVPDINGSSVSDVQAATMTVNPPTAYNMLRNFVQLQPGDWAIQNGANSGVGQAVIQIAASRRLKTINFVRNRPEFSALEKELMDLGATHVLPLEILSEKKARLKVKELTDGANIRLALNCVSGPTTAGLVGLLGQDAHLVSYGAMSKQPITLPTSAFIFKGLTAHGFMQNRWYKENGLDARKELMRHLAELMIADKLRAPRHTVFNIPATLNDEDATIRVRELISKITTGNGIGRKVLLKFDD